MRVFLAIVAAIGLAAVLWFLFPFARSSSAPVRPDPRDRSEPANAPVVLDEAAALPIARDDLIASSDEARSSRAPAAEQGSMPLHGVCTLRGRLVDDDGIPVPDAELILKIESQPPPDRNPSSSRREALVRETISDAHGRFAFVQDIEAPAKAYLVVRRGGYHGGLERNFGTGADDPPALRPGDSDLGDLVLPARGTLSGRVITKQGVPIASISVVAKSTEGKTVGWGTTDEQGEFTLECLAPGSAVLAVKATSWVLQTTATALVERRVTTRVPDITLVPSPRITGTVVDASGAPIAGIEVEAHPLRSGRWVSSKTTKEGTFELFLPESAPHRLEVHTDSTFEPWLPGDESRTFEPGTEDVHIVLARADRITFRVVDAPTGDPIPHFMLLVGSSPLRDKSSRFDPTRLPVRVHPSGTVELGATPGRSIVVADAAGHAPCELDVLCDPGSPGVMTIALERASSLRGSVYVGGDPRAGVEVVLDREVLDRTRPWKGEIGAYDLGRFPGRRRVERTDDSGAFEIGELAAGTYVLRIEGSGLARTVRHDLRVPRAGTLDLGRIDLLSGATARVRVLTAPGDSPVGFGLCIDNDFQRTATITSAEGTCEFTGLEPGAHALLWSRTERTGWSETDPKMIRFEVAEGESREIVIDARTAAPCTLRVRVTRNGKPAAGVLVGVLSKSPDGTGYGTTLAPSDASGMATGSVEGGVCDLGIVSEVFNWLPPFEIDVPVPPGGQVERAVDLRTGSLVIELPASVEVPVDGEVHVHLAETAYEHLQTSFRTPRSTLSAGTTHFWTNRSLDLGEVPVGTYAADIQASRIEIDPRAPRDGITHLCHVLLHPEWKLDVRIEEGKETRIALP